MNVFDDFFKLLYCTFILMIVSMCGLIIIPLGFIVRMLIELVDKCSKKLETI